MIQGIKHGLKTRNFINTAVILFETLRNFNKQTLKLHFKIFKILRVNFKLANITGRHLKTCNFINTSANFLETLRNFNKNHSNSLKGPQPLLRLFIKANSIVDHIYDALKALPTN